MKLSKSQIKIIESHKNKNLKTFSRRELMGLGLQGLAAYSLSSLIPARRALAETLSSYPSFMVFDLVGGAALPGNFLVGGKNGSSDLLNKYDLLGFNPAKSILDNRFGLPAPKNISRVFEGMIATMSAETQKNVRLTSILHQAGDDSNINTTSALGLVAEYLRRKDLFKQKGMGLQGTSSGGRTQLSLDLAPIRPEQLSNVTQLNLLTGLGFIKADGVSDTNINKFTAAQKELNLKHIQDLSEGKQNKFFDQMAEMYDNYVKANLNIVNLDPRTNPNTQTLFNLTANTSETDQSAIAAGIANACMTQFVGPSCIAIDGYDYHDGTQSTGDAADERAGQMIGRCVELASKYQRPFFFQILTDGSCSASQNSRNWSSDSGERTMTIMGYYDPKQPPSQLKTQIGQFTDGQIADGSTYVGNKTSHVANVVFLNYLSALGKQSEISSLVSSNDLPTEMIDALISFHN